MSAASTPPPDLPQALGRGRYVVLGLLGQGGMGRVLEVEDTLLGVRRAAKLLLPKFRNESWARLRMANEARCMSVIDHPRVVRVYDLFDEPERGPVLLMELVKGSTLSDLINRSQGGPGLWNRFALGVIEGVQAVHRAGLVHRDVKPANFLVPRDGKPQLADFGIAKDITQGRSYPLTHDGDQLGTARFSAPEQRASPADAGPAADVYGAGATLLCMWQIVPSVELPMQAENPSDPVWRELPDEVAHFIRRACRFDPTRRIQDGAQLRDAFETLTQKMRARSSAATQRTSTP